MERRALTINEIAELGGPKRDKAYKEIKAGRLRAVKIGRHTRILSDDFQKYLSSLPAIAAQPSAPGAEHAPRHGQRCGPRRRRAK
jgi:excisionase family DNA binding protein